MNNEIYHYGIKGMKWGVRRKAKKDAKEYARAQMYYGEGAGTRRKLIKNTVTERSKDPNYKKAFDTYYSKQNMDKHVIAAKRERKVNNAKKATVKTVRQTGNLLTGHPERVGGMILAAGVVAKYAHQTGADKKVAEFAKKNIADIKKYNNNRKFQKFMRDSGINW